MEFHTLFARAEQDLGFELDPNNIDTNSTNPLYIAMIRKYCKVGKCPAWWATIKYRPTIAGNVIYLLCFIVLLGAQIFYGSRKKTWTYMGVLCTGLLLEFIGYIGRIMLNQNPFIMNNFLV